MARKSTTKPPAKAPAKSAEKAAATAAPAAAEQLATQPAAPIETAPPAGFTPAGGTEQPVNQVSVLENSSMGQDAPTYTDQAAADAAATTSKPASAAPEAPLGGAVVTAPDLEAQADAPPAGGNATDAVDDLELDDGEVEGLWITAIPEQGFRRCGYRFTREGFGIALDALTAEQIEQLENEPNLKVERGIFSGRVGERVS